MENRSHALVAGFFVILFSLLTALALWWLGQSNKLVERYILETRKSVSGLNLQATVRFRGIRAGKVEMIETDPDDPRLILVEISLDSRFKPTRGTTAQLGYQGVTGLAFVQLDDDGSSTELLKVGAGGTAPRITLKSSLVDTLGEKAGNILTQISDVSTRLALILDDKNARNIARTLENAAIASEGMKDLPVVMASLRMALSAGNLQQIQKILAHVEKTAGAAAPLTADFRDLVRSMNALSQKLDRIASQGNAVGDEFTTTTLPRANALIGELNRNARQINQLLDALQSNPQMLIFGRESMKPGPGENGFADHGE